ncbi:hypothetical protein PENANT_c009G03791 [Penicillium antarcticum]|uniref:NADH-ubiquinone oxidoreductase 14 kDa subunit n=3 Tax=Penicillium TaxID=5073 RepID=A0A1V6QAB2_9EURO|nr:hypothetical protein PENANT_c009G03791 [Penicillium antarcticum]
MIGNSGPLICFNLVSPGLLRRQHHNSASIQSGLCGVELPNSPNRHVYLLSRNSSGPHITTTRPHPPAIMVHKVLFWSGFGIAVRLWQLGIEMRPILAKESLWVYPLFAGVGGSFGYWMQGVESRQLKMLAQRREAILEKRRRRDQREESEGVLAAAS